jgi:hypothetical protein
MEFVLIDTQGTEFNYAFDWVENHPMNKDTDVTNWEYVGTFSQGKEAIHSFKINWHPTTQRTERLSVRASTGFTADQIVKTFKV